MALEISQARLLVVEGKDEERFFQALVSHLGRQDIQILGIGGKEKIGSNLKALTLAPGFPGIECLGVVRDANANPQGAFQSVRNALAAAGLPVPAQPWAPTGENPRVAIAILPGPGSPGMLEDLCWDATATDPARPCVDGYFQCLQGQKVPVPNSISKARIHAFLASRERPGLRVGEAAEAGYWPFDNPVFHQVREFLRTM